MLKLFLPVAMALALAGPALAGPPQVDGDGTVLYKFIGPLVGSDYEQRFRPELEKALAAQQ